MPLPTAPAAQIAYVALRMPLLAMATAFGAGIVTAGWAVPGWVVLAAGAVGAAGLARRRTAWAGLALLLAALGHLLAAQQVQADRRHTALEPVGVQQLWGWLETPLQATRLGSRAWFRVDSVAGQVAAGETVAGETVAAPQRLQVYLRAGQGVGWTPGQRLRLHARLKPFSERMPPSYRAYLQRHDIYRTAAVTEGQDLGPDPGWAARLAHLRYRLALQLDTLLHGGPRAGLARALLLGDRSAMDPELRTAFARSGTAHLVAISGSHLSLVLLALLAVWRAGGWALYGRHLWRYVLTAALLVFYGLLAGGDPPVMRALWVGCLALLAAASGLRAQPWNLLGAAALLQLAADPRLLLDVGFQLSYGAVAGILLLYPLWRPHLPARWWLQPVAAAAAVCVSAQAFVLPLLAYHFGALPAYFLPANLLMQPLAALATLTGLLLLVLGWLPGLDVLLAALTALGLDGMTWLAGMAGNAPGANIAWQPSLPVSVVLGLGIVGGSLWLVRRQALRQRPAVLPPML